jgi:hypothetical protein
MCEDSHHFEDPYVHRVVTSGGQKPTLAKDEAVVPPDVTDWNATTSTRLATYFGTTSTALSGSDDPARAALPPTGNYNVEARVGYERQHVGTLRKDRLEKAIHKCIKQSCPLDDPRLGLDP